MPAPKSAREDAQTERRRSIFVTIGFGLSIIAIWSVNVVFFFRLAPTGQSVDTRGIFGDSFGWVNALFSGLAFAVIALTLRQQMKELHHQRAHTDREFRLTKQAAQTTAWIEAQRVFTTKEFTKDSSERVGFGEIRSKVINLERPITDWKSSATSQDNKTTVTREEALNVCRGMCEVADLVEFGGLDLQIVLRAWGDPFRKTWIVLAPLVREEQSNQVREWPLLWARFESIGETALRWFGWPHGWVERHGQPSAELLARVGWSWEQVRPKDNLVLSRLCDVASAIPPRAIDPNHWASESRDNPREIGGHL